MRLVQLKETENYELRGKTYDYDTVAVEGKVVIPLLNLKMMSDYEYQKNALIDREQHPEKYSAMGEDVDATVARIKHWLSDYLSKNGGMEV